MFTVQWQYMCFFYNSLKNLLAFHISSVSRLSVVSPDSLLLWTQIHALTFVLCGHLLVSTVECSARL